MKSKKARKPALPRPATEAAPRARAAAGSASHSLAEWVFNFIILIFATSTIAQPEVIPTSSMEDNLLIGDHVIIDRLAYSPPGALFKHVLPYEPVKRGDIIVFRYPLNIKEDYVKRVIGVPGDRVRMVNKQVFVNGQPLKEPYAHFSRPANDLFRDNFPRLDVAPGETPEWWLMLRKLVEDGQLIVPEGHYFVMGDNRDDSYDSRYWGFVPAANIIGRPLLIYWSVRGADEPVMPSSVGDKLYHFAYAITHLFQVTRWNRTLRLVN